MTLRSRLTAAFFAISVVPLSAVTLFSYVSSERALRRAAEQQANELADDLSRRMQWVTTDIERRLNRGWQTAMPTPPGPSGWQPASRSGPDRGRRRAAGPGRAGGPAGQPAGPDQVAGRLAGVFGEMAPLVEGLEFTPTPPRGAGSRSGCAGQPRGASRSTARAEPRDPNARPRPAPTTQVMTDQDGRRRRGGHREGDGAVPGRQGPDQPRGSRRVDGEAPAADPSGGGPAAARRSAAGVPAAAADRARGP